MDKGNFPKVIILDLWSCNRYAAGLKRLTCVSWLSSLYLIELPTLSSCSVLVPGSVPMCAQPGCTSLLLQTCPKPTKQEPWSPSRCILSVYQAESLALVSLPCVFSEKGWYLVTQENTNSEKGSLQVILTQL